MIDSETELPAQKDEPGTTWAKNRQAAGWLSRAVKRWTQAWPENLSSERLKSLGQLAGNLTGRVLLQANLSRSLRWARSGIGDGPLVNRFALHLVVVFLAVGAALITQVRIPEIDFLLPTPTPAPDLGDHAVTEPASNRGGARLVRNGIALFPAPVPHTTIPERERTGVITYTVQPNDNLWAIAQGFGLQVETLLWANSEVENEPDLLSVGQVLTVPPVDGVYHTVQKGDTAAKLAKKYKTSADKITGFGANGLKEPYTLTVGQQLMIPGGEKQVVVYQPNYYPMTKVGSAPKGAAKGSGRFAWPTRGYLSQRYWSHHVGIDIANSTGTPVLAADDGYVVMAGRDTWGYGNQVVIDHGNGFWTRYAHLQKILVKAGQSVKKNEKIGLMGSTGRSTGPHLHFEVIQNSVRRNPLSYLK